MNFGFLAAQEPDKIVSKVSGYCSPCGGFSSRLVLQYLITMQQYWNQFEAVSSAFYQAQKTIVDIILAKSGIQSEYAHQEYEQRYVSNISAHGFCISTIHLSSEEKYLHAAYQQLKQVYGLIKIQDPNKFLLQMFQKQLELLK